ncbi:MAG: hypothetical protein HRU13_00255 [Phycisphaerales bacterium]|nr:hypothetical protein [Phycisphaerales bacterium]
MTRVPERTIKDDRGRTHPMTRWVYRGQYPGPWHDIFPHTPATWRRFQLCGYFAFIPFGTIVLGAILVPSGPIRDLARMVMDASLYLLAPLTVIYIYLHFRQFRPWLKRYQQAAGRCRACGYDLANLQAESDGCTICPECGAAWRLDQAGT